jgi:hypothetical protein
MHQSIKVCMPVTPIVALWTIEIGYLVQQSVPFTRYIQRFDGVDAWLLMNNHVKVSSMQQACLVQRAIYILALHQAVDCLDW